MGLDAKKVFAISKDDDKSIATGYKRAYSNGDGTYTVEFIDGTKVVTAPIKGDKGDKGDKFEFSDFTPEEIESLKVKGDQGEKGERGNGIIANTKTGTSGLVDTYTIVYEDGTTTTYDVVNGANITKTSQLENDSEFITNATIGLINYYLKDEVYNKAKIDELLRNVGAGLSVKIVPELPSEEISGTTIYLINTSASQYNQYMYIDGEWASLGSTSVDLSSYYNKTQIDTMLLGYITASTLLTQLMSYTKTSDLAKVAKSNDYNDLDNLPTIPDVSGIKPYVSVVQDTEETAPTSKALYDAVQTINGALDDKADKTDLEPYALAETVGDLADLQTTEKGSVVGAVNEVNVNLGDIVKTVTTQSAEFEVSYNGWYLNKIPKPTDTNYDWYPMSAFTSSSHVIIAGYDLDGNIQLRVFQNTNLQATMTWLGIKKVNG